MLENAWSTGRVNIGSRWKAFISEEKNWSHANLKSPEVLTASVINGSVVVREEGGGAWGGGLGSGAHDHRDLNHGWLQQLVGAMSYIYCGVTLLRLCACVTWRSKGRMDGVINRTRHQLYSIVCWIKSSLQWIKPTKLVRKLKRYGLLRFGHWNDLFLYIGHRMQCSGI